MHPFDGAVRDNVYPPPWELVHVDQATPCRRDVGTCSRPIEAAQATKTCLRLELEGGVPQELVGDMIISETSSTGAPAEESRWGPPTQAQKLNEKPTGELCNYNRSTKMQMLEKY